MDHQWMLSADGDTSAQLGINATAPPGTRDRLARTRSALAVPGTCLAGRGGRR